MAPNGVLFEPRRRRQRFPRTLPGGAPGPGTPSSDRSMNVVRLRVLLRCVLSVVKRVQLVAVRQMGVMAGLFVLAGFRMLGCFAVMLGGCIEVFRRFMMVMMNFVLVAHGKLLHLR
jgi:hypothetical protein